ncbi:AAA family ATPase [Fervidicola ferrireducens]|nr:MoxR family ATPase [Fervidicola ferrireducens]
MAVFMSISASVMETLEVLIDLNLPVLLWGPPGVGKSSTMNALAEKRRWALIDMRLGQMSPVDLRGVPVPDHNTKRTTWYPPSELPDEKRDGKCGILFLDELLQAPRDVQSAALQLVLDRRLGEYKLPPEWRVVAASNRVSDKAGTYQIISSLANRFVHIPVACSMPSLDISDTGVEVNAEDWKKWALQNDVAEEIVAFINYRPNLLWRPTGQVAFPTPRMWGDYVNKIIKHAGLNQLAIAGCIGEGPAAEFMAFCKLRKEMPDPDAILRGEDVAAPVRPDVTYALCGALAVRVINANKSKKKEAPRYAQNVMRYLTKLPAEFQVLLLKDMFGGGASNLFWGLPEFSEWVKEHREVFLA